MTERNFNEEFWVIVDHSHEREERITAASHDEGVTTVLKTIIKGEGEITNPDYPLILQLIAKEYDLDLIGATEVFDKCEERVMKELEHGKA